MRLQSEGTEGRSSFSFHHFRELTYSTFVCTFTLIQAAVMVPTFFIQEYVLSLGIDETSSFHLLALINIAGLAGRFAPNFVADRYVMPRTFFQLRACANIVQLRRDQYASASGCTLHGTSAHASFIQDTAITRCFLLTLRIHIWGCDCPSCNNYHETVSKGSRSRRAYGLSVSMRSIWGTHWQPASWRCKEGSCL